MGPLVLPAVIIGGAVLVYATRQPDSTHPQPSPPAPRPDRALPVVRDLGALPVRYGADPMLPARTIAPLPRPQPSAQPKRPSGRLASLLQQPLPQAVEAARHRFIRGPVVAIEQGDDHIVVLVDPRSTSALLIPPAYLGWPMKVTSSRA